MNMILEAEKEGKLKPGAAIEPWRQYRHRSGHAGSPPDYRLFGYTEPCLWSVASPEGIVAEFILTPVI